MTMTLENLSRRRQLLELNHPKFHRNRFGYLVMTVREMTHNPKTGGRSYQEHKRKLSGTLTLLGKGREGSTVEGLPDEIAAVPAIRRRLRERPPTLKLVEETEEVLAKRKAAAEAVEAGKKRAEATRKKKAAAAAKAAEEREAEAVAEAKKDAKARADAKKKADADARAAAKAAARSGSSDE